MSSSFKNILAGVRFLGSLFFIAGLILGSFYNVVGLRVPEHQSIIHPPSHCMSCGHRLSAIDLIPVFSYLLSKGRCQYCHSKVPRLYPIVEAATAGLFATSFYAIGWSSELFAAGALVSLLVIIFVSDIHYMLIPDKVLMVFAPLFLFLRLWVAPFDSWWQPFIGGAVGFIIPFAVAVVSRGNMGGGDIKLFLVLGLILGWKGVLAAFFLSTAYGGLIGGAALLVGKIERGKPIPFGPFIVLGTLTAYFFGDALLRWYFHF
ncbi:MAG TPA: prepilin peptidase [Bacillales bacterium]